MLTRHRQRVLFAAAAPIARTLPWTLVAGILLLGWAPVAVLALRGGDDVAAASVFTAVVAAGAVAFAVDDGAVELTSSLPVPMAQRRGVRLLHLLAALAAGSLLVLLAVDLGGEPRWGRPAERFPEVLAVAAVALAVASPLARRRHAGAGLVGTAAGPLGVGLLGLLAQRFDGLPALGQQHLHDRWWWLVAAAGSAAAWSWRDPVAGRPLRWRR